MDHKSPLNEEELNQFIAQCKNIMDFESDKNPIFWDEIFIIDMSLNIYNINIIYIYIFIVIWVV